VKTFIKQILMLAVIVVIVAVIQHRVPANLPAPAANEIHGESIEIPVSTSFSESQQESWQLVQLPSKQYQVLVRYKYRIAGKFNATVLKTQDSQGKTFRAAGTVQFNRTQYYATTIHVNPNGSSGYIVFEKSAGTAQPANG